MDAFPKITDPLIGARLDGRYVITSVLGRGGMGVVYDGMHEALGRPVAIKVLSAAIAAEEVVVKRFLREARIAAGLGHGNIVDVSDLGHLPDGRPYLVMPKIIGISFSELLAKYGPQSPARVVELLRGVAAALDLVHAKKLVHRDVKPENLMFVVREDGSETVMLMDFGIAVLMSPNVARLTGDGVVCGTPAYIAPEAARGEDADHRADVYALATVAFELITGELPFDADNPMRILPMKAFGNPPRLSDRGNRTFPQAVEAVIARGLARLPEERFETAGAFVTALERAIDPLAGKRNSLPETQMLAAPKPPRITESLELPAGSSGEYDLDAAAGEHAPPDVLAVEQMQTQRTPRGAAAARAANAAAAGAPGHAAGAVASSAAASRTAVEAPRAAAPLSSTPPALPRSRRGLVGVLAAIAFVCAGLAFAAVWPDSPPPAPPAPRAREPEPAVHVATPAPVVAAPVPPPPDPAEPPAQAPSAEPVAPPRSAQPTTRPRTARTASAPAPTLSPAAPAPAPTPTPAPAHASATPSGPSADELNKQAGQELLQGHMARAAELFAQAAARDPRNAAAFRGLGLTSERLGRTREAVRAYKRALQLAPTGPQSDSVRARLEQLK